MPVATAVVLAETADPAENPGMHEHPHSSTTARSSASRPAGVLVVTIDRLPAWMLSASGATWVATPALDALAARGIVFDRVITPSPAVLDTLHELAMPGADAGSLFAAAATAGWRSAVVTDIAAVAEGLAGELAAVPGGAVRLVEAVAKEQVERDDAQTNIARLVDAAVALVAAGEHRLVWCHVGGLGVAWDAPEFYRERYIDPEDPPPPSGARVPGFPVDADTDPDLVVGTRHVFAGQLTLLDSQLGRLFAAVGQGGPVAGGPTAGGTHAGAGAWAVLVVGVRGLPLGLHGWVGAGGRDLPYGESIHVPAILVDAGGRMAAQRYGGLVVPADLGATLMQLETQTARSDLHPPTIDPAAPWHGVSLAGLFDGWSAPVRDRVVAVGPDGAAIVTPEWHGLLAGGAGGLFRLFAKPDDYFEQVDVADRCNAVADCLAELAGPARGGDRDLAWLGRLPSGEGR